VNNELATIPLTHLAIGFGPTLAVLVIVVRWNLNAKDAIYANIRMLAQLLAVGYALTYIFETDDSTVIVLLVATMFAVAAWIALHALKPRRAQDLLIALTSIGIAGLLLLVLVTQVVLDLQRWFEPRYVVPIAGMILANSMNTVSLSAERFQSESMRGVPYVTARRIAMQAAMIPQINALLAVGLVALPGMMTGQILSGVDPLIAVRYQIMVMSMIFAAAGLATAIYLTLLRYRTNAP
jgi:putative ABC transport system permease protein